MNSEREIRESWYFTAGSEVRHIETKQFGQLDFRLAATLWLVKGDTFWAAWDESEIELFGEPFWPAKGIA